MMPNRSNYYISRTLISLVFGGLFIAAGLPWWSAVPMSVVLLAFFLWAPKSGRYVVHPKGGVAPLRHDEYGQTVRKQAAQNAFVVTMLAVGGIAIYGLITQTNISITLLSLIIALGWLTYFVSDFWQRRL
jgi:hypothetical protein